MAFRVETTRESERDAEAILEWLFSQDAGDTGIRWFLALEDAIASLATIPARCPLAPENADFPFEVWHLLTVGSRTYTEFCSPLRKIPFLSCISATAAASLSLCRARDLCRTSSVAKCGLSGSPIGRCGQPTSGPDAGYDMIVLNEIILPTCCATRCRSTRLLPTGTARAGRAASGRRISAQ